MYSKWSLTIAIRNGLSALINLLHACIFDISTYIDLSLELLFVEYVTLACQLLILGMKIHCICIFNVLMF